MTPIDAPAHHRLGGGGPNFANRVWHERAGF
ncbi:hypothetical protein X750_01145 [Mesorhizobium sp. LNJC394B00]|nr:hypothetical protein X750_01145 [Mesorhizobium sp. LNJC394B00]